MLKTIVGVYCIENNINKKRYIGSSNNISYRFQKHLCELKNQRHRNKHLQAAVNKYGISSFNFSVLEECSLDDLRQREQSYIDKHDWDTLYNKTKFSTGGGGDLTGKKLILLDLLGNIVERFDSGCLLAKFINRVRLDYKSINTPAISKKEYRIVTPYFYENNKDIILSWNPYSVKPYFRKTIRRLQVS
jgi:predicted GIY-YIG superfamily endonuclease